MKKYLFILLAFLFGCSVTLGTLNLVNGDGKPKSDTKMSEQTEVNTDADIPITGQGTTSTND
jgi:hypothetical protein